MFKTENWYHKWILQVIKACLCGDATTCMTIILKLGFWSWTAAILEKSTIWAHLSTELTMVTSLISKSIKNFVWKCCFWRVPGRGWVQADASLWLPLNQGFKIPWLFSDQLQSCLGRAIYWYILQMELDMISY